jgi:hypothetical protein
MSTFLDSHKVVPSAASPHTVARYRLLLVKDDEECLAEPETLMTRPVEMAAFLWKRVFDGLDREAMCSIYVDH